MICRAMLQGTIVAIENKQRRLYGIQYHPEVQHSERGIATLRRFLFGIAKMPADWKIENVLKEEMDKIRGLVRAKSHAEHYAMKQHSPCDTSGSADYPGLQACRTRWRSNSHACSDLASTVLYWLIWRPPMHRLAAACRH